MAQLHPAKTFESPNGPVIECGVDIQAAAAGTESAVWTGASFHWYAGVDRTVVIDSLRVSGAQVRASWSGDTISAAREEITSWDFTGRAPFDVETQFRYRVGDDPGGGYGRRRCVHLPRRRPDQHHRERHPPAHRAARVGGDRTACARPDLAERACTGQIASTRVDARTVHHQGMPWPIHASNRSSSTAPPSPATATACSARRSTPTMRCRTRCSARGAASTASTAAPRCAPGCIGSRPTSASTRSTAVRGASARWRKGPSPADGDPEQEAILRESIRLAFVAALQHLPPRQRAVLLLTQVLGWSAAEVATSLDLSVAAVNSALQRARATLSMRRVELERPARALSAEQSALVSRYMDAFERYDVKALTALMHEDATLSMPPYSLWLQGHEAISTWLLGRGAECRGSRLVSTFASGAPAFGQYRHDGTDPWAIIVLEFSGDRISSMTSFLDTASLFPMFGLPPRLG